jgi:hypothetical protein
VFGTILTVLKIHLAKHQDTCTIQPMPLFTTFKKAKDAAVEHKKIAAAEQVKPPAPPYKHVPTHAKQDALATQPTTLRPEELQARIAAARKSRAASWQSAVPSRHSVYHSCESSRASSRTNSTANIPSASTSRSMRGKGNSAESIDAILQRPHSASHKQSPLLENGRLQPNDLSIPVMGRPSGFPLPPPQRPRYASSRSRKSSFTKKKSPLSSVSVEEGALYRSVEVVRVNKILEPDEMFSSSSNTSAVSTRKYFLNNS